MAEVFGRAADEVLEALDALVDALNGIRGQIDLVARRAEVIRQHRARGATYAEIMTSGTRPLVPEVVSTILTSLLDAGSRLRRAQADALYAEGLSMDKIARIFRVSRQRVSALLHTPAGGHDEVEVRREPHRGGGLVLTDPEFRLITESIPHFAFLATADGSTDYFNRQGAEYTGLQLGTTYRGNWWTFLAPEDVDEARSGWQEALRTETPYLHEARIRRVDGVVRWYAVRALPVRHPDGHVTRWIGTATDIDDLKRVEAELGPAERTAAEALSLLKPLERYALAGFGLVDRASTVLRMNERLAAINGAPLDDQLGRPIAEVLPTLWPQLEDAYRKVLETGEPVGDVIVVGYSAEEPRRSRRWLADYYPVHVDDVVVSVGLVIVDTSEGRAWA
ncbi:MAG: PAS domain-containing protein [Ilumatobacteraceae bacterium]